MIIYFLIFSQERHTYEKVGESTEVALKVLIEKLNVQSLNREHMTEQEKAKACCNAVAGKYVKVSTAVSHCSLIYLHILGFYARVFS